MPGPAQRMPKKPVDLIVVVTGGQGRLKKALEFFEEGKGEYLLISGVGDNVGLNDILEANAYSQLPEILRTRIILGSLSRSTTENAKEIKTLIGKHDFASILFVTSAYHLPRASRLLKRELERWPESQGVQLFFHSVDSPNYSLESWWKSFTGWRIFLSEYFKSYLLRFSIDTVYPL